MLRVGGWANIQVVDVSQDTYEGAWYEQNNKTLETHHENESTVQVLLSSKVRLEKDKKKH